MTQHLKRIVSRVSAGLAHSQAGSVSSDAYRALQSVARELAAAEVLADASRDSEDAGIQSALVRWDAVRQEADGQ